jgi:hypothetical protein
MFALAALTISTMVIRGALNIDVLHRMLQRAPVNLGIPKARRWQDLVYKAPVSIDP